MLGELSEPWSRLVVTLQIVPQEKECDSVTEPETHCFWQCVLCPSSDSGHVYSARQTFEVPTLLESGIPHKGCLTRCHRKPQACTARFHVADTQIFAGELSHAASVESR